jgi:iron complex outermembrane receptor protein
VNRSVPPRNENAIAGAGSRRGLLLLRVGILMAGAVYFAGPAMAQTTTTEVPASQKGERATRHFEIPAQSLSSALRAFARTSGTQILTADRLTDGVQSPALNGNYTVIQALTALLTNTGLEPRYVGANTVTVQRPGTASADGSSSENSTRLDPITVLGEKADGPVDGYRATQTATATWTDTPIRDVPQSIQVVSRKVLADREVTSLGDSLETVSNVTMLSANAGRADTFSIRGFDVRNYKVDGMTLNQTLITDETNWDTSNVERVEVLKGPSSVLYGDTYYGGSINVVTRKPEFTPGAEADISVGGNDFYRGQFSFTGPVGSSEELAYRLSGSTQSSESFRDVSGSSIRKAITPSLLWQPTGDFKAWASLTYTEQQSPVDSGLVAVNGSVPMDYRNYYGEDWAKQDGHKTIFSFGAEKEVNDWLTVRARGNINDGYAHRIRAQAVRVSGDLLTRRAADQYDTSDSQNFILDAIADIDTGPISHKLLAGIEYQDGNREVDLYRGTLASISVSNPVHRALPGAMALQSISKSSIVTRSFFMQDQIDLTDQIKLMAGLRFDDISQTSYTGTTSLRASYLDETSLTPRIGAVYQPTDWLSIYASYSEAFNAQSGSDINGVAFDPETGKQYEVGAKFDLIPDQLSATVSAFRILRQGVLTSDPTDSDYSIQTGEQRSQGFELDVSGEVLPGWNVTASAAYLDATVTSDEDIPVGNRLANVPAWSGSIWSTYEVQNGAWEGFGFGGGLFLMSERQGDIENTFTLPGYGRTDLTAFYRINEHFKASLTVKNVFDKSYLKSAQNNLEIYAGDPRTVMFRISGSM